MDKNTADAAATETSAFLAPPIWFWVVTVLALLWYVMDMSAFYMRLTMTDDAINAMPEGQQHLFRDIPKWVNVVFAGEVFGGLLGSVALLLRRRWALPLFVVSILGTLGQTANIWFLTDAISAMGAPAVVMPIVALVICVGLILFSRFATSKRWIS